jgi:hypothetical protein
LENYRKTPVLGADKQPPVNLEISAASVHIPCARLHVRPGPGSRVKEQATRTSQQERRPALVREPVRREDLISIGVNTHGAVAHVIGLCASRVAIADPTPLCVAKRNDNQPVRLQSGLCSAVRQKQLCF